MHAEDALGLLVLFEGLMVLCSVLASLAALRTVYVCCGLSGRARADKWH